MGTVKNEHTHKTCKGQKAASLATSKTAKPKASTSDAKNGKPSATIAVPVKLPPKAVSKILGFLKYTNPQMAATIPAAAAASTECQEMDDSLRSLSLADKKK